MAKTPTTKTMTTAKASTAASAKPVDGDVIRMLTGQEGPSISRVRSQKLTVGEDIGADEAGRLIDAEFAERA